MWLSKDNLNEQYYLVSKGVRALAAVGYVNIANEEELNRVKGLLREMDLQSAISFMIPTSKTPDKYKEVGFARSQEILDLYVYARDEMPEPFSTMVTGMLHGYSTDHIIEFAQTMTK